MNTKTKAILAYSVIFLIGFASGYLLEKTDLLSAPFSTVSEHRPGGERHPRQGGGDREDWIQRAQDRLSRDLELSESQKDPLFEQLHDYHRDIRRMVDDRRRDEQEMFRQRYSRFREEISSILDSVQLQKMDSHFHPDTVQARMERRMKRGKNRP